MTANNENMTLSDFLGDTGDDVENDLDNRNNQQMNDGIEMQVINGTIDEDDKDEVSIQNTEHINDESSHTFGNNCKLNNSLLLSDYRCIIHIIIYNIFVQT